MPTDPNDVPGLLKEQIKLLRQAETDRQKNVTRGDLATLSTSLLGAVASTDKKVEAVANSVGLIQGQLGAHGVAIASIDGRVKIIEQTGGIRPTTVMPAASYPPRRMSPMPRTYKSEETSPGRIRVAFDKEEWDEMQDEREEVLDALRKHEEELSAMKAAEAVAKEKEKTAQERQGAIAEYAAGLEKKAAHAAEAAAAEAKRVATENDRKRGTYLKLAGLAVPVLLALGSALAHWLHL